MIQNSKIIPLVAFIMLLTIANPALSNSMENKSTIGKPGVAKDVSREINLTQVDNMFLPNEIWVVEGETIRFVVRNKGDHQHELLIGTMDDLRKAAKMRRNHPDEIPTDPGMIRLQPGEQGEIIWTFDQGGEIDFVCPLPGHFKGMQGKIYVEKK